VKVVAILFHFGAACVSPLEASQGSVTAYKVECATIIVAPDVKPPPTASPAPAKPIAAAPVKVKKVKKSSCVRRWYWKNHKRRYRCR